MPEKPIRILFVSGIYPPDIGGPATYVSRMAHEMDRSGRSVKVLALGDRTEEMLCPFQVRRVKRGCSIPLRTVRMLRAVLKMAREADIIYATGSPWDSWIVSVLAAMILRKRLVIKVVGDSVWERAQRTGSSGLLMEEFNKLTGRLDTEILKGFRNFLATFADLIITPSAFLKNVVGEWGVRSSKIKVIYNAVEKPDPCPLGGEGGNGPVVTIARLVPWKGVDGLIRAIRILPETIRLVIIGDGPLMHPLVRQVKEEKMEGRVSFTGRIPKEEVFRWLSTASVFVLNSRYEGFPHTILEAMAAGVPVIATSAGGNVEAIKDGESGFLVPIGDEKRLAEKLSLLFQDRTLRRRFAEKALVWVNELSWDKMVEETETALRNVLR